MRIQIPRFAEEEKLKYSLIKFLDNIFYLKNNKIGPELKNKYNNIKKITYCI